MGRATEIYYSRGSENKDAKQQFNNNSKCGRLIRFDVIIDRSRIHDHRRVNKKYRDPFSQAPSRRGEFPFV